MSPLGEVFEILTLAGELDPDRFYALPAGVQDAWIEHVRNLRFGRYMPPAPSAKVGMTPAEILAKVAEERNAGRS